MSIGQHIVILWPCKILSHSYTKTEQKILEGLKTRGHSPVTVHDERKIGNNQELGELMKDEDIKIHKISTNTIVT